MIREHEHDDLIDLGAASIETRGPLSAIRRHVK